MKEAQIVDILNNYLDKKNILYANEVRMGIGIPDVMYATEIGNYIENINDYYLLRLYDYIKKNNVIFVDKINATSFLSKEKVSKYLQYLEEKDIINLQNSKIKIKKHFDIGKVGTNISIEVKIKNWKMGVFQAMRYLSFSDYSYLALLDQYIKNVDIDLLKSEGIGLLSVKEGDIIEVLKPKKSKICNNYFKHISFSGLASKMENYKFSMPKLKTVWA